VSDLLAALPMAIVMVAGPQIISAIFLATSDQARRNSVTFLLGVALATTTGTTIAYLTAGSVADPSAESSDNDAIDYAVIAFLCSCWYGSTSRGRKRGHQRGWASCRPRPRGSLSG
jgi:hypothetical protein